MNNNRNIRNLKSSRGQEKQTVNLYWLSLEMGNARDRYKTSYRISSLLRRKLFNLLWTYKQQKEKEFFFSTQRLLLCAETDYSERKTEI